MKRELIKVLTCPVGRGEPELEVTEERDGEITSGGVTCPACHQVYPISEGIPKLLPPELRRT